MKEPIDWRRRSALIARIKGAGQQYPAWHAGSARRCCESVGQPPLWTVLVRTMTGTQIDGAGGGE